MFLKFLELNYFPFEMSRDCSGIILLFLLHIVVEFNLYFVELVCLVREVRLENSREQVSIDKRVITVAALQGQPGTPSTPISLHFKVPSF